MERYFVGLDVSKDETAICVKGSDGRTAVALKKPTGSYALIWVMGFEKAAYRGGCSKPARTSKGAIRL